MDNSSDHNHGSSSSSSETTRSKRGKSVLVLVAKFPSSGRSKTRLAEGIGNEKAMLFAHAMIDDTLERFGGDKLMGTERVLYFSPKDSEDAFRKKCSDVCGAEKTWTLLPMPEGDLKSSSLTHLLMEGLRRVRNMYGNDAAVAFCGMDSPLLSAEVAREACEAALSREEAVLCPANDGGYVLVALPPKAPLAVFEDVEWSSPHTLRSQQKRLEACRVPVRIGDRFVDVDTIGDLVNIRKAIRNDKSNTGRLQSPRVVSLIEAMRVGE